ncbi:3406_t:CDS:2 [Entrophospora sp. SA101]|nr:15490_t:CDS:2 [Entrophospora sp. SA101]CAJ0639583.1 3406_t:CDS:2 [Entrophospora sp. SA101]CAJ0823482.1 8381_t:CDS:2 [Entrophospora sp. SA101]CAJ0848999.1 12224_t:CDS:2 [Entrophospora sp. SA101]CAJ0891776.1 14072_t:CDS:2 [Entrophospora sp. SA101]
MSGVEPSTNKWLNGKTFIFVPEVPCRLLDFYGGRINYDPSQDNYETYNQVVEFFRHIIDRIEVQEKIMDYKFFISEYPINKNQQQDPEKEDTKQKKPIKIREIIQKNREKIQGFYVKITEVDKSRHPPQPRFHCISCDQESETNKISKLNFPTNTHDSLKLHNLWLDAKARPMFIVTPKRHLERLSQCNNQEIFSMFYLALQILEQEVRLSKAYWNNIRYIGMTLNHGIARNIEHLHLKVKVLKKDFIWFRKHGWDEEKEERYKILESGLYKRDARIARK